MNIAVLVSGGVDSSVALAELVRQGHTVTAFYLKIWLEDEVSFLGTCPWEEDLSYVRAVCEQLDVPLHVVNMQREYWDYVVAYTIRTVKEGKTPNPDMFCNKLVKFGFFLDYMDKNFSGQFDKIATGHYAQVVHDADGTAQLLRAPDPIKDQSYFLAYLTQEQLSRALFPIGHLHKSEVRALAQEHDLPNKDRKDSQGICFLGKLKFSEFLRHYLGTNPGDLVEYETGRILGQHDGYWYYTIGQRQGMGLAGGPWYVVSKNVHENIVYVSREYFTEDKKRDTVRVTELNWLSNPPKVSDIVQVKMRHGKHLYDATVENIDANQITVRLHAHDQGIAPGQFAVFYDGQICLGAGIITL